MRDRKKYCRKYHKKNREKILSRKKAYYEQNKKELNQKTMKRHEKNRKTWEGYIPLMTQCEMCGRDVFFHRNNQREAIHFDHRKSGTEIIKRPMLWLAGHSKTPENQKIWESCEFGILCGWCNKSLPTINRKQYILNALKYVLGFKISYSKLDNHRLNKNRVNSGNSRTDNPEPSHQIANRLVEGAETKAEETIMPISALDKHNVCQDIVRHSEESEITVAMAIMQLHKEV